MGNAEIPRPDAPGEPIAGVVRGASDPVETVVVERDCAHNWTNDLLTHDRHIRFGVSQHGRLDETPLLADAAATGDDLGALLRDKPLPA